MATTYIHMGHITRPHGIKGELCIDWYADSPELLREKFFLQAGKEPMRMVTGAKVRMHKGRPLLTLPQIQNRTDAEALRGMRIYVDRSVLPEPEDDEVYINDILGIQVVDHDSGVPLGTLERVDFPTDAQDLWVIKAPGGQEILLPAVEEFIMSIDLEEDCVRVCPPEGLVELYLQAKGEAPDDGEDDGEYVEEKTRTPKAK